jgi:hypothetical protein
VSESFGFVSVENLPPVQPVKFSDSLLPDDYNRTLSICAAATSFPLHLAACPVRKAAGIINRLTDVRILPPALNPSDAGSEERFPMQSIRVRDFIRTIAESGGFRNPVSAI